MRRAALLCGLLTLVVWPAEGANRWGWFGIRIRDLTEVEMEQISARLGPREGFGVLVVDVVKGSPAETSTLRAGDLIVAVDGVPITETRVLQRLVGATPAGQPVQVTVIRREARQELVIKVGDMPTDLVAERVAAELGFVVRGAGADGPPVAPAGERPAVVGVVAERSAAARAGMAVGDRVVAVNGSPVASLTAFQQQIQSLPLAEPIRLRVERDGVRHDLVLFLPTAGLR